MLLASWRQLIPPNSLKQITYNRVLCYLLQLKGMSNFQLQDQVQPLKSELLLLNVLANAAMMHCFHIYSTVVTWCKSWKT